MGPAHAHTVLEQVFPVTFQTLVMIGRAVTHTEVLKPRTQVLIAGGAGDGTLCLQPASHSLSSQ